MKRRKRLLQPTRTSVIDPDQAYRIQWRGVRLAKGCFRAFCSQCHRHLIEPTEKEARCLSLVCGYCRDEEDIAKGVQEIMAENARRAGGSAGPCDDESPWESNNVRHLEDAGC